MHIINNKYIRTLPSFGTYQESDKYRLDASFLPASYLHPLFCISLALFLSLSVVFVYAWYLRNHGRGEEILCFRCFPSHYKGWLLAPYPWQGTLSLIFFFFMILLFFLYMNLLINPFPFCPIYISSKKKSPRFMMWPSFWTITQGETMFSFKLQVSFVLFTL